MCQLLTKASDNNIDDVDMDKELFREAGETQMIYLHALTGVDITATMRIQASVKTIKLIFLIDSGSFSNFISQSVAKKMGLSLTKTKRMKVMVLNDEKLLVNHLCMNVHWQSQGIQKCTNF